jgi:hypothetical protein
MWTGKGGGGRGKGEGGRLIYALLKSFLSADFGKISKLSFLSTVQLHTIFINKSTSQLTRKLWHK